MSKFVIYILILFLSLGFTAKAQKLKKEYFDKHRIKTNNKSAEFYRTVEKTKDSLKHTLYLVRDYYITDTLQMIGFYLDEDLTEKIGKFYYYYPNGLIKSEMSYNKIGFNGEIKHYFESGNLESKAVYQNDTILSYKRWYDNKQLELIGNYKKGERDGAFVFYHPNGNRKRTVEYKEGEMLTGFCYTREGEDTAYYPMYVNSKFPGGFAKFVEYIKNGIQSKSLSCGWFNGAMQIYVKIDETGKITESHLNYYSDDCYLKNIFTILENSPTWIPAKKEGINVSDTYLFRISFPNGAWRFIN